MSSIIRSLGLEVKTATLNGVRYQYLLGLPPGGTYSQTIFLIHGFPDLAFGWRHTIPTLLSLGLRVIALDMIGYGGTEAPRTKDGEWEDEEEVLRLYTFKRAADDVVALGRELGSERFFVGGHDWGGIVVYNIALWYPDAVLGLFSLASPFIPESSRYIPLSDIVEHRLPNFRYQLQLSGPDVERFVESNGKAGLRAVLASFHGAKLKEGGGSGFTTEGLALEKLLEKDGRGGLERSKLESQEELDYYVEEYSRTGFHGPLNWYRKRKQDWEAQQPLRQTGDPNKLKIHCPTLFVQAKNDTALPPQMSQGMEKHFAGALTIKQVEAGHWVHWQKPEEVNAVLREWFVGTFALGATGNEHVKSAL